MSGSDDDILRFDIAVEDARFVCSGQCPGNFDKDFCQLFRFEDSTDIVEFMAIDQFHDDGGMSLIFDDTVHGHDAAILKSSRLACLLKNSGALIQRSLIGVQHLDGNRAIEGQIPTAVNHSDSTSAEFSIDLVSGKVRRIFRPVFAMARGRPLAGRILHRFVVILSHAHRPIACQTAKDLQIRFICLPSDFPEKSVSCHHIPFFGNILPVFCGPAVWRSIRIRDSGAHKRAEGPIQHCLLGLFAWATKSSRGTAAITSAIRSSWH